MLGSYSMMKGPMRYDNRSIITRFSVVSCDNDEGANEIMITAVLLLDSALFPVTMMKGPMR
jgi:hypothetical protein